MYNRAKSNTDSGHQNCGINYFVSRLRPPSSYNQANFQNNATIHVLYFNRPCQRHQESNAPMRNVLQRHLSMSLQACFLKTPKPFHPSIHSTH